MANIDGPKYTGPTLIDFSDVKDHLVDLAPGAMKGARAEKDGLADVLDELAKVMPDHGDAAEVHPSIYQRVLSATTLVEQLRAHESALAKALEVCRETRAKTENNREDDISAIATKAEEMAEKGNNPGLAAHFEKTIKYKSQIAERAAETRRKNEEAKAAAAKGAPPAGQGGGAPPVT